jgi:hypothetical protein
MSILFPPSLTPLEFEENCSHVTSCHVKKTILYAKLIYLQFVPVKNFFGL